MTYLDGQPVMVGDIVEINNHLKHQAVVVEIIASNSRQAIEWNSPKGGVMIDDPIIGLTLWPDMDEDIKLLRRK